jgi:site-specific DNA recombinase
VHTPGAASGNAARHAAGKVTPGIWEPLVDRPTFKAVQRILTAPERRTSRPGRGVHLLSMIARCHVCEAPLGVTLRKDPAGQYTWLNAGHVRISKPDLDIFAEDVMLKVLAKPREYQKLLAAETNDAAITKARREVADVQAEWDDLAAQLESGAISATLAARSEPGILARLADAKQREQNLQTPSLLRGLIKAGPGVQKRWQDAPMSTRREVARILLSPEMIGELRVARRPRDAGPRRIPVEDRVVWKKP